MSALQRFADRYVSAWWRLMDLMDAAERRRAKRLGPVMHIVEKGTDGPALCGASPTGEDPDAARIACVRCMRLMSDEHNEVIRDFMLMRDRLQTILEAAIPPGGRVVNDELMRELCGWPGCDRIGTQWTGALRVCAEHGVGS